MGYSTFSTRTLLFLDEGSANSTISGCLNRPDTVNVVAGGVISGSAVAVTVVVGSGMPEATLWSFVVGGLLVLKLDNCFRM